MIAITIKLATIPLIPLIPSAKPNIRPCSLSSPKARIVLTKADQYVKIVVIPIKPNIILITPKEGIVEHHNVKTPVPIKENVSNFL